jgi:hypothetical protein
VLTSTWAYVRRHHIGFVALLIAMSGTAYAAATIGPRDIKDNAVRSRHIKDRDVRPNDLMFEGVVLTGKKEVDYAQIPPHHCTSVHQVVGGLAHAGDLALVEIRSPATFPAGVSLTPRTVRIEDVAGTRVAAVPWTTCNITDDPINPPPAVINIAVIRH